jgi:hypothetical protein
MAAVTLDMEITSAVMEEVRRTSQTGGHPRNGIPFRRRLRHRLQLAQLPQPAAGKCLKIDRSFIWT